jgi:hypothetical protein
MGAGVALGVSRLTAAALALALAGCGNDGSQSGLGTILAGAVVQTLAGGGKAATANPVSRQVVADYGLPLLRVQLPARRYDGLLALRDDKGAIRTWTTTDGITLTLRDGVLIETRGLGIDLMSSSAPSPAQIARPGQTYDRSYFVTGDNDANERRSYSCSTANLGAEVLDLLGETVSATRFQETCVRASGKLVSDYWMIGGAIRQSRQWVSPDVGYAVLTRYN